MNDAERNHTRKLLDELARHAGLSPEQIVTGAARARADADCGVCAEIQEWAHDRIDRRADHHPTDPHQ